MRYRLKSALVVAAFALGLLIAIARISSPGMLADCSWALKFNGDICGEQGMLSVEGRSITYSEYRSSLLNPETRARQPREPFPIRHMPLALLALLTNNLI